MSTEPGDPHDLIGDADIPEPPDPDQRFRPRQRPARWTHDEDDGPAPGESTYPVAIHGPDPVPDWVITESAAHDAELGVLKTGKEADVFVVERTLDDRATLLAAKRYRTREHRSFHRDASYLEGRRVRDSREMRAMANRTAVGKKMLSGQWAGAEFHALGRLWCAGVPVPYPVQLLGTELMLEFIGDADTGVAAPRLAETHPSRDEAEALWVQMLDAMRALAAAGWAHGDLSPYNVLVDRGRVVLIDLPQVVEIVRNPRGFEFLHRDVVNVTTWFARRGLGLDAEEVFGDLLALATP